MHATDLVGINGITRVLLVYTCQQGVYPRGHVLALRLPMTDQLNKFQSGAIWSQLCILPARHRQTVSGERVETIRQSLVRSPQKSVRRAGKELNVPKTTLWKVLWKRLHLRPYRLQIL
jgi:hypothetical protein